MFEKLKDLICEKLSVEPEDVTAETSFADDLEADSIALFELVMAIEEEFNVKFEDEDIEEIATVGDVVAFLESNAEV